jgi:Peptidase A4 family
MSDQKERIEKDLDLLLRQVNARTRVYEVPKNFVPITSDDKSLVAFGFSPLPDRRRQPEQYAFWQEMFAPPVKFVEPAFSFRFTQDMFGPARMQNTVLTRYETSENWSGGYIKPRDGMMFTEVYGRWRVPTPLPPIGATIGDEFHSSTWIGLDGQRQYYQSTLPQIGTAQHVRIDAGGPTPMIGAWWQWWERNQMNPPVSLAIPVHAGDFMMCAMKLVNLSTVRFYLKNATTGDFVWPFDESAPPATPPVEVSGATAEWVMERPRNLNPPFSLYELPKYGTVGFSHCLAVAADAPGQPGQAHTLAGAKLIDMFAVRDHPPRTADISIAKKQSDQQLATFYR